MVSVDLIRLIDPTSYSGPAAGHYLYDPGTRELLLKRPWIGGGRLQTYAVITSSTGAECATGALGPVMIAGGAPGSWIELFIDYRAWVEPQNVTDLIRECASDTASGGDGAGRRLASRIFDITQRVAGRDPAAFDQQDHRSVEALQGEIQQILLRQCGLTSIIKLRTAGETTAPTIQIEVSEHTADFPEPVSLQVKVETFLRNSDRPQAAVALAQRPARYLELLVERVARDVLREARTAQLRLDLNGEIKRRVLLALEPVLAACYIRIRAVHLSLRSALSAPQQSHETELIFDITPPGYPGPVQIRVHAHLQLADEGTYWSSGATPLHRWLENEGCRVATRSLFGATYTQLCLEHQRWGTEVVRNLQLAARSLGYDLTAQVHLPALSFNLRGARQILVEGDFSTAISDVITQLEVAVRVQLDSLESVRGLLDRGLNLDKIFHNTIEEELTAYLHTLHPGHLFMYFNQPPPLTAAPGTTEAMVSSSSTVEAILRQRVEQVLRRYELKLQAFTAKLGSSHLRSVYDALMSASAIEFTVEARLANQVVPVPHLGSIEVSSIPADGWQLFQRKQPSPADLSDAATRAMATLIDNKSNSLQHGLTPGELRELAYQQLPKELLLLLGVQVRCVDWRRQRGEDDLTREAHQRALQETLYDAQLKMLQAQIPTLIARRELALLAGDDFEAEQITAQLERLQRGGSASRTEHPRAALPQQTGTSTIDLNAERR